MTKDVQTALILEEVFEERRRQCEVKGYTAEHDRQHDEGELAMAAAAFAVQSTGAGSGADILWPFPSLMPAYATRRHRLIVAAALIVAEIERIDGRATMADGSVNDIPDAELLGRAVRGFKRIKRGDGGIYRWAAVGARFALGSTYAQQLCRRFGLDPDEKVRKP